MTPLSVRQCYEKLIWIVPEWSCVGKQRQLKESVNNTRYISEAFPIMTVKNPCSDSSPAGILYNKNNSHCQAKSDIAGLSWIKKK